MLGLAQKVFGWRRRLRVAALVSGHTLGNNNLDVLSGCCCCCNWLSVIFASQVIARALFLKTLVESAIWLIISYASRLIILNKLWTCIIISLIWSFCRLRLRRDWWSLLCSCNLAWELILSRGIMSVFHPILVLILILTLFGSGVLRFIMILDCVFGCIIWARHYITEF